MDLGELIALQGRVELADRSRQRGFRWEGGEKVVPRRACSNRVLQSSFRKTAKPVSNLRTFFKRGFSCPSQLCRLFPEPVVPFLERLDVGGDWQHEVFVVAFKMTAEVTVWRRVDHTQEVERSEAAQARK